MVKYMKRLFKKMLEKEVLKRAKKSAKLNAFYEQSAYGMFFIGKGRKVVDLNDRFAQMLGYTKDEILSMDITKLTYSDDREKNSIAYSNVTEGRKSYFEIDKRCTKKDGSLLWLHVVFIRLKKVLVDDGVHVAVICQDITDKIKLSEDLKAKEEMMIVQSRHAAMGNMMGMIAHQWKQPLSIIGMIVNNFKLDHELGNTTEDCTLENFNQIEAQVNYLSQTIDDFRNFFKPNKEKELKKVDDVLEQSLKLVGKSLQNNQIEVLRNYDVKTEINVFPNELVQVFINLLNNAKDAIVNSKIKNPQVIIDTFEDEHNIFVNIRDNGGGIPEDVIEKIGDIYFTTKGELGTGLGVYMSKMIIEKQLEGELKWENYDGGALFSIIIPKTNT
jgi:PAS domain S-box-containing protein